MVSSLVAKRNTPQRAKLIGSFTNDPYSNLATDLRSYDEDKYTFA
ncbi:MAG: hypothetical protein NY202_03565 [Mollicutes bacterium UO1]